MDKGLYPGFTNIAQQKDINFKAFVDAGNAPTLAPNPLNTWVTGVSRTGTGTYVFTVADTALLVAGFYAELTLNAASTCYAQAGPTTGFGAAYNPASPPTFTVFTLVNGVLADPPAANANIFLCGVLTLCDIANR